MPPKRRILYDDDEAIDASKAPPARRGRRAAKTTYGSLKWHQYQRRWFTRREKANKRKNPNYQSKYKYVDMVGLVPIGEVVKAVKAAVAADTAPKKKKIVYDDGYKKRRVIRAVDKPREDAIKRGLARYNYQRMLRQVANSAPRGKRLPPDENDPKVLASRAKILERERQAKEKRRKAYQRKMRRIAGFHQPF